MADHSVRHDVLQPDVLWPVGEAAGDPGKEAGVLSLLTQFVLKHKRPDGFKGT